MFFLFSGFIFTQEDSFFFEDNFLEEEGSESPFSVGGVVGSNGQAIMDYDNLDKSKKEVSIYSDIELLFEGEAFDISGKFDLDLEHWDDFSNFPLQDKKYNTTMYVDTLFFRYYHTLFDLEIGLMKPVWGNADSIHNVDVLNPLDYSDTFGSSYLDRKLANQMIKVNIPIFESSLFEAVYLPIAKGDNIPMSGIWTPYYIKSLEDKILQMVHAMALTLDPSAIEADSMSQANTIFNSLSVEEQEYFVDSQLALRYTTTIDSIDLGFTYFWGFLKQPTIDPKEVINTSKLKLIYNRVHTFGIDIAAQLGSFNVKGEFAYNLTEDVKGSEPGIINNEVNYIFGFDINIPINNINFLIQCVGSTIINSNEITVIDSQYRADGNYSDLMLMGRISDKYFNEKFITEISGGYDLFEYDYMVKPELTYKITDNTGLEFSYLILGGDEDTDFGQFRNNDTFTISLELFF